jgi:hypothetical protein
MRRPRLLLVILILSLALAVVLGGAYQLYRQHAYLQHVHRVRHGEAECLLCTTAL